MFCKSNSALCGVLGCLARRPDLQFCAVGISLLLVAVAVAVI
jgi:hypothetical protein